VSLLVALVARLFSAREEKSFNTEFTEPYSGNREDEERAKRVNIVEPGPANALVVNKHAATEQTASSFLCGLREASVTSVLKSSFGCARGRGEPTILAPKGVANV